MNAAKLLEALKEEANGPVRWEHERTIVEAAKRIALPILKSDEYLVGYISAHIRAAIDPDSLAELAPAQRIELGRRIRQAARSVLEALIPPDHVAEL